MCGIIGINEHNEPLIRKAGATFKYRGPDASALFSDSGITLGHHRLSILDTDPRSTQPLCDSERKIWIVFNGEIFNFKKVRARLKGKYTFETTSDTEVLVYAYKEWGKDMTLHIEGMFALAIYDMEKQIVLLLRDHQGIKPLYYYAHDGIFGFASECKGLAKALALKGVALELDQKAIDLYMVFGYIPSPYSLYKGVIRLPKASYVVYDLKAKAVSDMGHYKVVAREVKTEQEYVALIEEKVLSHLIADVPVGVFFSGGTDSTLIAAILHKHKVDLETFSIKLDYKTEDAKYFGLISEHLKLKSNVYDFDVSTLDSVYEEVMGKLDEPSYDNSIFPTYYVSKMAAQKVKVVLSGEGGDEFFYGYPRSLELSKMKDTPDYSMTFLDYVFFALPPFKAKNHVFQKVFRVFKKPISYYLLQMSIARDRTTFSGWKAAKEECRLRSIEPMALDQELYLENDLLRKTDLATSYSSIEGRVPLLDVDILQNAHIVEDQKLEGGVLKAFLKKMLATYIPREMVYRSKSGFGVNMVTFFEQSKMLKPDLERAVAFLAERGIKVPVIRNTSAAVRKYPHLCFALIALYRSIVNNER